MVTSGQGAFEIPAFRIGIFEANSILNEFVGVALKASTGVGVQGPFACDLPAVAGEAILGVIQNAPQVAEAAELIVEGVSRMVVGATAVVAGNILVIDINGNVVPAVAASGSYGIGMALQSGATGNVIAVLLRCFGKQ